MWYIIRSSDNEVMSGAFASAADAHAALDQSSAYEGLEYVQYIEDVRQWNRFIDCPYCGTEILRNMLCCPHCDKVLVWRSA